jgi:hypothetical protein
MSSILIPDSIIPFIRENEMIPIPISSPGARLNSNSHSGPRSDVFPNFLGVKKKEGNEPPLMIKDSLSLTGSSSDVCEFEDIAMSRRVENTRHRWTDCSSSSEISESEEEAEESGFEENSKNEENAKNEENSKMREELKRRDEENASEEESEGGRGHSIEIQHHLQEDESQHQNNGEQSEEEAQEQEQDLEGDLTTINSTNNSIRSWNPITYYSKPMPTPMLQQTTDSEFDSSSCSEQSEFMDDNCFAPYEKRIVAIAFVRNVRNHAIRMRNRKNIQHFLFGAKIYKKKQLERDLEAFVQHSYLLTKTKSSQTFIKYLNLIIQVNNPYYYCMKNYIAQQLDQFERGNWGKVQDHNRAVYYDVYFDLRQKFAF